MSGIWAMIEGVAEELWLDFGDGLGMVLQALGLSSLVQRLRQEIATSRRRKRKSLIRILGSALPLKPVQRPYLRYVALRSLSTSCDSLYSAHTQGRIDPKWLAETERSSRFRPIISRCETAPDLFPLGLEAETNMHGNSTPRSSTPFSITSDFGPVRYQSEDALGLHRQDGFQHSAVHASSPFTDPGALAKISALETELSQLRQQISLILNETKRPLTPPSSPTPVIPTAPPPPPPPLPPPPPPPPTPILPPPPPPPPPFKGALSNDPKDSTSSRKSSFSDLIAQRKENINKHTEPLDVPTSQNNKSRPVSMADVLKGLNKVKLKRVSRSPGGTPVRSRPKTPPAGDPASIIAAALKKRFAKMHVDSPEKDNDDNEFNSSPENTPQMCRRSRVDFQKQRTVQEENHSPNFFKALRKPSPRIPKPKQEEKASLPMFGQHLLKRRTPQTPEPRDSVSPSSEASDLSR